jgi:hypothetical protein
MDSQMMPNRWAKWQYLLAVAGIVAIAACATEADKKIATSCTASGGKWIADTQECEIGTIGWCEARSGKFDPCASACRNTRAQTCIMVCVPVCKLP